MLRVNLSKKDGLVGIIIAFREAERVINSKEYKKKYVNSDPIEGTADYTSRKIYKGIKGLNIDET